MNNDLISRSALLEALENDRMIFKSTITVPEALLAQGKHWRRCLESAPAVDAVEVVRCRECIHNVANHARDPLDTTDYSGKDIVCAFWLSDGLEPDDYCSRGKMKGGSL